MQSAIAGFYSQQSFPSAQSAPRRHQAQDRKLNAHSIRIVLWMRDSMTSHCWHCSILKCSAKSRYAGLWIIDALLASGQVQSARERCGRVQRLDEDNRHECLAWSVQWVSKRALNGNWRK